MLGGRSPKVKVLVGLVPPGSSRGEPRLCRHLRPFPHLPSQWAASPNLPLQLLLPSAPSYEDPRYCFETTCIIQDILPIPKPLTYSHLPNAFTN